MIKFRRLFIATATSALLVSVAAQAADSSGQNASVNESSMSAPVFTKLPGKASFIHGDNLIDGPVMFTNKAASATPLTLEERAEALKTVMVTREGDQYESV
ncbi:MAG: hypothetical protein HRT35_01905, partial [Algicola sp.]|nr:hypothetical protein [Algicola sp.]